MTREDTAEDVRLAARIRAGDQQAVEALYQRYADPLFAFIFHRLDRARSEADDVWQETWLAAVRALPGYRGESRLFTWLCAIARHKIADRRAEAAPPGPARPGGRGRGHGERRAKKMKAARR